MRSPLLCVCSRECYNTFVEAADAPSKTAYASQATEFVFEPVPWRAGTYYIRSPARAGCADGSYYLSAVLACPPYSNIYWAPLNDRDPGEHACMHAARMAPARGRLCWYRASHMSPRCMHAEAV